MFKVVNAQTMPAIKDKNLTSIDEYWMRKAMRFSYLAQRKGEVPVGAVLVQDNKFVAGGCNLAISLNDPSAHAEMIAIRRAGQKMRNYRLVNTTLYVTLEPCSMCAGLLVHSRITRLVYAAADAKTGSAGSVMNLCEHSALNHQVEVCKGVLGSECSQQLSLFFRNLRLQKAKTKNQLSPR